MKRIKCEECGGKIINKKVDFSLYRQSLGKFSAEVCSKCGEVCFSEEVSDQIDKVAKERDYGVYMLEQRFQKQGIV